MAESEEKDRVINQCPECDRPLDVTPFPPFAEIVCPLCDASVRVRTALGHYEILSLLGEGGMSQVFRARDLNLGREVALKILHQSLTEDESLTAMFEREAKLTASIHHPNVVKVYTVGQDQGYFFIAMELVDATSLEQLIARDGAHSEKRVLAIAQDVTTGLRAAQQAGLIHRDIKPGNMLVTGEGTTKLVDFGLALQHDHADEIEELWATPFYVPPEKLDGQADTFAGDIYSLGATLYHAVAGKPPFEANTSSLVELKAIKSAAISLRDDAPGASKPVVKLIDRMMALDPAERPESYDQLLAEVEETQLKLFGATRARVRARGSTFSPWIKRAVLGGVALLALVVIVSLSRDDGGEAGGGDPLLEAGLGERVIDADAHQAVQRFLEARTLMTEGKFERAGEIFAELEEGGALPPSAAAWTAFNHGLVELFLGGEPRARKRFAELVAAPPFETGDEAVRAQEEFLRRAAADLAAPLPPMPSERDRYPPSGFSALGLLAGGLKNWQMGQFEAAEEWFTAFDEAQPGEDYAWVDSMRPLLAPFREDLQQLEKLPRPSISQDGDELQSVREKLERSLAEASTAGRFPVLVRQRIDRIDRIAEAKQADRSRREAEEREKAALQARAKAAADAPGTAPPMPPDSESGKPESPGGESDDREQFADLLRGLQAECDALRFSEALEGIEQFETRTDKGGEWKNQVLDAYRSAAAYPGTLARVLDTGEWEGQVRRREGKPLDAAITAATADTVEIDLGFGPNDVAMADLALDWLVETGRQLYPEPDDRTLTAWQELAWFARVCGMEEEAEEIARSLFRSDEEFREQWRGVGRLLLREKKPELP